MVIHLPNIAKDIPYMTKQGQKVIFLFIFQTSNIIPSVFQSFNNPFILFLFFNSKN